MLMVRCSTWRGDPAKNFACSTPAADAVRHLHRAGGVRLGQHDDEFLAAVTGSGIDFAHVFHQHCGDVAQHLVADVVAIGIVQTI